MKKLISCVLFFVASIFVGCDQKPSYTLAKQAREYADSYVTQSTGTSNLGLYGVKFGIKVPKHDEQELVLDTKFPYENLKVGMLIVFQAKERYILVDHPVFRKLPNGEVITKGHNNMEDDGVVSKDAYVGLITKVKNDKGEFITLKY